jgi:breast cancer 2 susceptibility protein
LASNGRVYVANYQTLQLSSDRKEPVEILDAYNSTRLILMGNSSHLAPWHAKLGFQFGMPPVSTMNKLTADGGVVAVMDLVLIRVYPIAFLELIEEDGTKRKEGPWNEKEEVVLMEKWKVRSQVSCWPWSSNLILMED